MGLLKEYLVIGYYNITNFLKTKNKCPWIDMLAIGSEWH